MLASRFAHHSRILHVVSIVVVCVSAICVVAASAVRAESVAVPLKSLHQTTKVLLHQPGDKVTSSVAEFWYSSPDKFRFDIVDGGQRQSEVIAGQSLLTYRTDGQAAILVPASPYIADRMRRMVSPTGAAGTVAAYGEGARIVSEKVVAGRTCDVVETGTKSDARFSMCIDKATGIALANASYRSGKPEMEEFATLFEPNVRNADHVFDLTPPKGMLTVRAPYQGDAVSVLMFPRPKGDESFWGIPSVDPKRLSNSGAVTGKLRMILQEDKRIGRKSELKAIYAPSFIPERFGLLVATVHRVQIKQETSRGQGVSWDQKLYDGIEITYVDSVAGDALILTESVRESKIDPDALSVPDFAGKILESKTPFPHARLIWSKDGVFFNLGGANVSKTELIRVAKSMRVFDAQQTRKNP